MKKLYFFIGLIAMISLQSCKTTQPAIYPEPVIGATEFEYWIHSPLHPENKQPVTFKTEVTDNEGIAKVELYVYEYELYYNNEGLPSKRRRVDSQWGLVYDWEFELLENEVAVDFTFSRGFRPFSNIEYIFRVYNGKGEMSERLALFDAGDSPWPLDKIMLYATSRTPLSHSINLCLFPDIDYQQDWRGFLTDMESMIYQGFHANNKIKSHKENWQFYYTQREADGYAIANNFYKESVFPNFIKHSLIQGMDAFGLMHKEPYSDGAYLKNNIHFLAYNLFTAESYNFGTAVHESAHAIFNLSDEYDLCACFEHPEGANVFSSLKGCQEFNKKNGFPIEDCTMLKHLNGQKWFMSEQSVLFASKELCEDFNKKNGYTQGSCERFKDFDDHIYYRASEGVCIMQDDGDHVVRDFKRTCSRIIDNFYYKLNKQPIELFASRTEEVENIYGYEPIVLMELINTADQLAFEIKSVQNGVPNKNLVKKDAIQLDFIQSSGEKGYSISLPELNHFHIHREGEDAKVELPVVNITLAVPYQADLQTLICAQYLSKNDQLIAKGAERNASIAKITRVDLVEPLQQAQDIISGKVRENH